MCPTAGVATAVGPEDIICNLYLKPSVPTYGSVRQRHPLPSTPLQMQKKATESLCSWGNMGLKWTAFPGVFS